MFKFSQLFRFNFIRNHYTRFGIKGLGFYIKSHVLKIDNHIEFKHHEFKHPVLLRKDTSDVKVFYQVLFNLEYDIKIDFEVKNIIDLGANIGMASVYF